MYINIRSLLLIKNMEVIFHL